MMKRYWIVLILGAMSLFLGTVAYAGILGSIWDHVTGSAVEVAIGALIGAIGMLGLTWKLWAIAIKELGDFVLASYKSTRPESNGGTKITEAEMQNNVKELGEFWTAFGRAWTTWRNRKKQQVPA